MCSNRQCIFQSCVQIDNVYLSQTFDCSIGTRQGCMISTFVFIFYLEELLSMTKDRNCGGVFIDEAKCSYVDVCDDIVGDRRCTQNTGLLSIVRNGN